MIYNNRVLVDSLVFDCATLLRIISGVIGARISSRILIKWRIFIDAKLSPSRNGYFLLNEYGDPQFLFHIFAETVSSWSSKKYELKSMASFLVIS